MLLPDSLHATPDLHGVDHAEIGQSTQCQQHSIKITSPTPALVFGHDVLIDHITSLQKRDLVGRWHFADLSEAEMRIWVDTKWKPMLGYMPTVVKLLCGWYVSIFSVSMT